MGRVLVTGGEGFLGRHIQEYLQFVSQDYDSLDAAGLPTYKVDITQHLPQAIGGYDRIIHLAGILGTHELFDQIHRAIDVNIKGTVNVLQLAAREGIPFHGITMDHVWTNPYETTKLAAERLAEAWGREYGFPVKYTTVYNAFGEGQAIGDGHPQKIIPTFARHAWDGTAIPIWGDGSQIVDLVYAGDIARLMVDDMPYDGGYGIPLTVFEVADLVWSMVRNDKVKVRFLPMRRGEHTPTRDPVAKNPMPVDDFEDKLEQTVRWYQHVRNWPL